MLTLGERAGVGTNTSVAAAAQALIEEARRHRRRRWRRWTAGLAALALGGGVLAAVVGGSGGSRGAVTGGPRGEEPFGTCGSCTSQSSASALAQGHWERLPPAPIAPRMDGAAVWTGHRLVIWGGASGSDVVTYGDGAVYNPTTRRWQLLSPGPLGSRWGVAAVWTGSDVFIWGGTAGGAGWTGPTRRDGAMYDPLTRRWTPVPPAPIPARDGATAVWTGHEVVVLGGRGVGSLGWQPAQRTDGAAYDPATRRWHLLPASPFPFQAMQVDAAWNGSALVVTVLNAPMTMTATWTPGSRHWHLVATPASLASAVNTTVVWTGTRFVYLDDSCPITVGDPLCISRAGTARAFDPGTGRVTKLPASPAMGTVDQWTGRALLSVQATTGKGAAYDPATNRWRRLPTGPRFTPFGMVSVWTGRELIEWAGVTKTPALSGAVLVAARRTA